MRRYDKNQTNFTFNFNYDQPSVPRPVEGGNQETLSDFEFYLRQSIKEALDRCAKRDDDPLDRFEVAARMSRKLGREITKTHIDQWAAMSTVQRRIHADALKALCEVINDWGPLHRFVESCGFVALHPEEASAAEYGSKMLFKRMIDSDLKDILSGIDEQSLRQNLLKRLLGGDV